MSWDSLNSNTSIDLDLLTNDVKSKNNHGIVFNFIKGLKDVNNNYNLDPFKVVPWSFVRKHLIWSPNPAPEANITLDQDLINEMIGLDKIAQVGDIICLEVFLLSLTITIDDNSYRWITPDFLDPVTYNQSGIWGYDFNGGGSLFYVKRPKSSYDYIGMAYNANEPGNNTTYVIPETQFCLLVKSEYWSDNYNFDPILPYYMPPFNIYIYPHPGFFPILPKQLIFANCLNIVSEIYPHMPSDQQKQILDYMNNLYPKYYSAFCDLATEQFQNYCFDPRNISSPVCYNFCKKNDCDIPLSNYCSNQTQSFSLKPSTFVYFIEIPYLNSDSLTVKVNDTVLTPKIDYSIDNNYIIFPNPSPKLSYNSTITISNTYNPSDLINTSKSSNNFKQTCACFSNNLFQAWKDLNFKDVENSNPQIKSWIEALGLNAQCNLPFCNQCTDCSVPTQSDKTKCPDISIQNCLIQSQTGDSKEKINFDQFICCSQNTSNPAPGASACHALPPSPSSSSSSSKTMFIILSILIFVMVGVGAYFVIKNRKKNF